ncbi:DUF799 domain-containing protein [Endozoicomonas sp. YOMI1]|uniref:DUF799 domain-containing protein n=1 Tax=Endozoicomonas sp. YOMI1 TaxID=2828739 RepID=UPI0021472299|nr:DUF799 domain-containing protein [Endozoicomonas sp. YOMI1]
MMAYMKKWLVFLGLSLLTGCAVQAPKVDFSAFQQANPASILVVPVVNESVDVDAPNYFLSTISVPLAEKGYYVFPVNTVKTVLEGEGLYDANLVHSADPVQLGNMFGADAILYVTINEWDAQYIVLSTTVTVGFTYRIVSGKTGEELWSANKTMQYTPQQNNSSGNPLANLLVMAVSAAITRAAPNYLPLTQQANYQVLYLDPTKLPNGPYLQPKS